MSANQPFTATCPKCSDTLSYVTAMPYERAPQMLRTTFMCRNCNRTWTYTLSAEMVQLYANR
jgi:transposase-like protein